MGRKLKVILRLGLIIACFVLGLTLGMAGGVIAIVCVGIYVILEIWDSQRTPKPKPLPDEVFQLAEREPVSLFDPAPAISPIRTWSEQRKEWVMIHTKDCMCAHCHFPLPLDGDLYRERAKHIFDTADPTPEQRDFAKRVTWAQNYTGVWVESEKPTTQTNWDKDMKDWASSRGFEEPE